MSPLQFVSDFINAQAYLVYFIYGLVYFSMGFAILLQYRGYSTLNIARHLPLLACFGIAHGLADWSKLFIPIQAQMFSPEVILALWQLYLGLLVTSFLFLFAFGLSLVVQNFNRFWVIAIPAFMFALWLVLFLGNEQVAENPSQRLLEGSALARSLLTFPAAILTAYGLYTQLGEVTSLGFSRVARHLQGAVIMFAFYAVVAGLIGPPAPFFPANILNRYTFEALVGFPVEAFRALTGIGIAYFIIRFLGLFNIEMRQRLEAAERNQTMLQERERISRDIHDGTLQSLYGVGLRLEHCGYLLRDLGEHPAQEHLNYCVKKLNSTLIEIRSYITDLHIAQYQKQKLRERVEELAEEFFLSTGIKPSVVCEERSNLELNNGQREHIYLLVKEALNNIAKHSGASVVGITVSFIEDRLDIIIQDDGCGFEPKKVVNWQKNVSSGKVNGQGLRNMACRVKALMGKLKMDTGPGRGTRVCIQIPLEEEGGRNK